MNKGKRGALRQREVSVKEEIKEREENFNFSFPTQQYFHDNKRFTRLETSLLASLTTFFVSQLNIQTQDGRITSNEVPWQLISTYLVPYNSNQDPPRKIRTPESCKRKWIEIFPNSYYWKASHGFFFVQGDAATSIEDLTTTTSTSLSTSDAATELETEVDEPTYQKLPNNVKLQRTTLKQIQNENSSTISKVKPRKNWTNVEVATIHQLQKTVGNKWTYISGHLPNRTPTEIKNYWHQLNRKSRSKK